MGKTMRLRSTYRKRSGPKQKLDDQSLPVSPDVTSQHAEENASHQIEEQDNKRKRSRLTELEQLNMDKDEGTSEVQAKRSMD